MRKTKRITREITAIAMAIVVLCITNTMPVAAAVYGDNGMTTKGVITPWPLPDYITVNGSSHSSNSFGVRAGNTVRVEVTVTSVSSQYSDMGLGVALIRQYPTNETEQVTYFYGTGNHTYTFTISAGGSYYINFGARSGCGYTFTYKITY